MKELLQQYAAYNIWANKTLFNRIGAIPKEKITQEIVSSFPSVYKTALHMWQAESIWWQRVQKATTIMVISEVFKGSFEELVSGLAAQSQQWKDWVDNTNEEELHTDLSYVRNNEPYSLPLHNVVLHLFNHATFHRGQLVTFLRQLGETDIPSTDFSTYCLSLKQA